MYWSTVLRATPNCVASRRAELLLERIERSAPPLLSLRAVARRDARWNRARGHPRIRHEYTNETCAYGLWFLDVRVLDITLSLFSRLAIQGITQRGQTPFVYSCSIRGWLRANLPDQRTCDTLSSPNSDKEARTVLWLK
jgi:hypothetical protein